MVTRIREVQAGFKRGTMWLVGLAWLGLVLAGMAIAFTKSPHSPLIGWALLFLAAIVAAVTMDRWIKIFPGLIAYGVLGSIFTLASGHAVNHPEVGVSRMQALVMILFFGLSTVLSLTFINRKLYVLDRIALLTFVFCFFWQAVAPNREWLALSLGSSGMLLAWSYEKLVRERRLVPRQN